MTAIDDFQSKITELQAERKEKLGYWDALAAEADGYDQEIASWAKSLLLDVEG